MSGNRIIVGQSEWTFPQEDAEKVVAQITSALQDGTVATLTLTDSAQRSVEVFVNGRTVQTVVIDLDAGPRPSEIS